MTKMYSSLLFMIWLNVIIISSFYKPYRPGCLSEAACRPG